MPFIDYDSTTVRTPKRTLERTQPQSQQPSQPQHTTSQGGANQNKPTVAAPVATQSDSQQVQTESKPVAKSVVHTEQQSVPIEQPVKQQVAPKIVATPKKSKQSGSKRPAVKKNENKSDVSYLRNFPTVLILEAKRIFPQATTQTDAVAALMTANLLALTSDKDALTDTLRSLPDSVMDLVKSYEQPDVMAGRFENIDTRLAYLTKKMPAFEKLLRELEFINIYHMFDYMGYRREELPASARNVDFMEPGVEDLIARAREQSKQFMTDEDHKNGRRMK